MTTVPEKKVRIAAAGRTNAGKTTLIRSLTRTEFGKIGDEANTTQQEETVDYEALQATFIDLPGFQNAGAFRTMLAMFKHMASTTSNWVGFKKTFPSDVETEYDERAFDSLERADIVLYVASLKEDPPNHSHRDELELIKSRQPRVIGILNKYGSEWTENHERADRRVKLWQEFFRNNQIKSVVVYDSHWDKPSKISEIYDLIDAELKPEQRAVFSIGLERFKRQQRDIRRALAQLMAECVFSCRRIEGSADSQSHGYNEGNTMENLRMKLCRQAEDKLKDFVTAARQLYLQTINCPTLSSKDFALSANRSKNQSEQFSNAASAGTVGGSIGAIVGGIIGTLILPGPGTLIGVAIGGGAGGAGGAIVGADAPTNTHFRATLSGPDLQSVFTCCLALSWAMSFQGFGKGDNIGERVVNELRDRLGANQQETASLHSATMEEISELADHALSELEEFPPVRF